MLNIRQSITIVGESVIDEFVVSGFRAEINSTNPEHVQFSYWQNDPALYKANRTQIRADQAAFEDQVYLIQDELIAKQEDEPTE